MLFDSQLRDLKRHLPWVAAREQQQSLRSMTEQRRRHYDAALAAADSAAIVARIEQLPVFQQATTVLLYYPIRNEVDLRPLLSRYAGDKTLLLPVTHRDHSMEVRPWQGEADLTQSHHTHVPEPQTAPYSGPIDLILVPGVVFDTLGHRIGRGGGYYDRFLRRQKHAVKIGVCYDFQLKHSPIPQSWRDQALDGVISPQTTIVL